MDATGITPAEEIPAIIDTEKILQELPEIKQINSRLTDEKISLAVIALEKNREGQIKESVKILLEKNLKFLLLQITVKMD